MSPDQKSVPQSRPLVLTDSERESLALELLLTAESLHATAYSLEKAAMTLRPPRPALPRIAPCWGSPRSNDGGC